MKVEEMCDEEFNKYFEEETNKQTFEIKIEKEPIKVVINYDYYCLLLKKIKRLESKNKILESKVN